jgi:hypothetical protein
MRGLYAPVPPWVYEMDLFSLVVAPVWLITTLLVRLCLRLPKPPRAVFEVSDEQLTMVLRESASSKIHTFEWPRSAVIEARANRYDRGLWINVPGHVKETYLSDLPRETIERLETALGAALASTCEET